MNDYWRKAIDAAVDARMLLEAGRTDGAVSRAYYAMFDGARAALEIVKPDLPFAKTHSAIINRFSFHVVVGTGMDPVVGRYLNAAETLRIFADYDRATVAADEAATAVQRMDLFLAAVAQVIGEQPP